MRSVGGGPSKPHWPCHHSIPLAFLSTSFPERQSIGKQPSAMSLRRFMIRVRFGCCVLHFSQPTIQMYAMPLLKLSHSMVMQQQLTHSHILYSMIEGKILRV